MAGAGGLYTPRVNKPTSNQQTQAQKSYTSGIDPQGKAYLYDLSSGKMVYYGAANDTWHQTGAGLRNQGYNRIWEGDQSGGGDTTDASLAPTGSAGSGRIYANTDAARAGIYNELNSLGGLEASMNAAAQKNYDALIGQYSTEDARAQDAYNTQTQAATDARSKGQQSALTAAAQGARGLNGVLASLGALSGDGATLANRAVAQAANNDLGNVDENYTTNTTNLNNAWGVTQEDQKRRRAQAEEALTNARVKNSGEIASMRMKLNSQLADKYSDAGMFSQANSFASRSGDGYGAINAAAAVGTPSWTPMSASFNPGALSQYLGGGYDQSVGTSGQTGANIPMNTPLFAQSKRRDRAV